MNVCFGAKIDFLNVLYSEKYDKIMCIICQNSDGRPSKVAFKEIGTTILSVTQS